MKKNAMLKIAAILMVAVLLTTCAISSTFAKYVSNSGKIAAAQARVAKWGITVSAAKDANEELFLNTYDSDDNFTVKGASEARVVAPGTKNDNSPFTVAIAYDGTPEVSYTLKVEVKFELGDNWVLEDDSTYYCPLYVKVGTAAPIFGMAYTSADDFEKAVEDAYAAAIFGTDVTRSADGVYEKNFAANAAEAPVSITAEKTAITWEWKYTPVDAKQTDANDTVLGNAADATIDFDFSISAEQID